MMSSHTTNLKLSQLIKINLGQEALLNFQITTIKILVGIYSKSKGLNLMTQSHFLKKINAPASNARCKVIVVVLK
jgi:hypothetical protein